MSQASQPFVSVVVPMRNEADWVERCLESIQAQDYPADRMEILVADGESDDGSTQKLAAMAALDPRIHVIPNPGRIVPTGLNLAIAVSKGEVIARIDAHTMIERDYLRRGVEVLMRTDASNVGGPMVCRGGTPIAEAIATAMESRFGIGAAFHFVREERDVDTAYMGLWPRQVFEQVGLFDEELIRNQDDELNYRIRKAGGRIVLTPAMRSRYQNRESWKALIRQFFQYGLWKVRVLQKHPRQMSIRHFVPPAFQLLVGLALLVGLLWHPAFWTALAVVALYAGFLAVVAVRSARDLGDQVRTWLAFVLLHQCWAAGFLTGLWQFRDRWRQQEPPPRELRSDRSRMTGGWEPRGSEGDT